MKHILFLIFSILFLSLSTAQNSTLLSKRLVNLSATTIWNRIVEDNKLNLEFEYLDTLDFYFITYKSDEKLKAINYNFKLMTFETEHGFFR